MEVTIGISNKHVHLKQEHFDILFDGKLNEVRKLNQPGQYASDKFVDIKTESGILKHVRVLGPIRDYTQIEISKTDARILKIDPPVRESGDVKNSSVVTLQTEKGSVTTEGCIIADRHIHILPKQAKEYGLENVEEVDVLLNGEKGGIISHVKVRCKENSYYEMHLDTDDANAHLVKDGDLAKIVKLK